MQGICSYMSEPKPLKTTAWPPLLPLGPERGALHLRILLVACALRHGKSVITLGQCHRYASMQDPCMQHCEPVLPGREVCKAGQMLPLSSLCFISIRRQEPKQHCEGAHTPMFCCMCCLRVPLTDDVAAEVGRQLHHALHVLNGGTVCAEELDHLAGDGGLRRHRQQHAKQKHQYVSVRYHADGCIVLSVVLCCVGYACCEAVPGQSVHVLCCETCAHASVHMRWAYDARSSIPQRGSTFLAAQRSPEPGPS